MSEIRKYYTTLTKYGSENIGNIVLMRGTKSQYGDPYIGSDQSNSRRTFYKDDGCFDVSNMVPSAQNEINWLNACIKVNKFVPYNQIYEYEIGESYHFDYNFY